jgi:hypothetical protein
VCQLQRYGETEFAKFEQAYGKDLDTKLQSVAGLVDALDKKTPGLKNSPQDEGHW